MLSQIGQIALRPSADVDRTEKFYEETLGLRKLYRFGDLVFFDCAGVRLMLGKARERRGGHHPGRHLLQGPGHLDRRSRSSRAADAPFIDSPHLIAPMPDHDLWMTFIRDPDGHLIGLMMEAPKGWTPPPA